jgi:DNA-binding transcriptional ArsR family regulator
MPQPLRLLSRAAEAEPSRPDDRLDAVFAALSDPVRRTILACLDGKALLVSEIARAFDISLQAVSRHIQVLVRAGLIEQERTGRISRCSLVTGPIYEAAVWLNRYSKYWQDQFDLLAVTLHELGPRRRSKAQKRAKQASANRKKREEK